jgi:hypothetical protein
VKVQDQFPQHSAGLQLRRYLYHQSYRCHCGLRDVALLCAGAASSTAEDAGQNPLARN